MNISSLTPLPLSGRWMGSWWMRNRLVRFVIDAAHLLVNLLQATFGRSPRLVGQKRFVHELRTYLARYRQPLRIEEDSVWVDGRIVGRTNPHLSAFLPMQAVTVSPHDSGRLPELVEEWLYAGEPPRTHEFYRATWLYLITFSIATASTLMIVLSFIDHVLRFDAVQNTLSTLWIISNAFLLTQMYIFHKTRLRSLGLERRMVEATESQETALRLDASCAEALILVPTYREEAELLRRSLLSHTLQLYSKKKVVLLLGNEVHGADEETLANTRALEAVVATLNAIWSCWHERALGANSAGELAGLYREFALYLENEAVGIERSPLSYPTDSYVTTQVLRRLKNRFETMADQLINARDGFATEKAFFVRWSESKIEIFLRMKYANVEHEKTKAGNLTAYLDLVNRDWSEKQDSVGTWTVEPGARHDRYRFVSIFDCDTIPKSEYLLRKIAFLQQPGTERIGLIQSPYVVPFQEPTVTGAAAGVHSYWFLPISLGLSSYGSAFWLGFNSCWRVEALEKIPSFVSETVIEDVEVSLQLIRKGYRIVTSPEQQCMTYSPKDIQGVQVQRTRWASGGLRILWNFVRDVLARRVVPKNGREFFLRTNYVITLNLLPVFITLLFIMQSPLHYLDVGYVMVQFLMYLWMYFLITSRKTEYKWRQLFDGLAISYLMNFYYLRGLKTSLKMLFRPGKDIVFKATPRQADVAEASMPKRKPMAGMVGHFEIIGSLALLYVFTRATIFNWTHGYAYDAFPIYQASCILYAISRFVGWRAFFSPLLKKSGVKAAAAR